MEELDIDREKLEAEYAAYTAEWQKAYDCGVNYFKNYVKPFTKDAIDPELWATAFVAGWFQAKTNENKQS